VEYVDVPVGQAVEVRKVGVGQAHPRGGGVHGGDERGPAWPVGLGQRVGGVTPGRQQQGLQQFPRGQVVPGTQARVAGVVFAVVGDDPLGDLDPLVQVSRAEHHDRGHHLGDAAHRAFGVHAPAPQHGAAGRVDQGAARSLHAAGSVGEGRRGRGAGEGRRGRGAGEGRRCRGAGGRLGGAGGHGGGDGRDRCQEQRPGQGEGAETGRQAHGTPVGRHRPVGESGPGAAARAGRRRPRPHEAWQQRPATSSRSWERWPSCGRDGTRCSGLPGMSGGGRPI
jgi:hypothetical protein